MQQKYDAILVVENLLNEASRDPRLYSRKPGSSYGSMEGIYTSDDPKMHSRYSYGNMVSQYLNNLGHGFSAEVTDFKKWVVVKINHHDVITGKTSSKTFLIVFQPDGDGIVLSTHNKYRTVSGTDQACSYIKSACNVLQSDTQNRV